ncbi:MAG: GIY-YIG nuclease family protein [Acidiferrobacterales bacterium]
MEEWHLYLVRTRTGALYTGVAKDVERRLAEHESSKGKGAKYLRSKGPFKLTYRARIGSRALALKVEAGVRRLSKQKKEELVAAKPKREELLRILAIQSSA